MPSQLKSEYKNKLGELLKLSGSQMDRLKKKLRKELHAWEEDTKPLHDRLERWNDLMENIVPETDYPFEGASNIHIPIVAIFAKVYHSIQRRSILGSDQTWYLETLDDNLQEHLPDVEGGINYKARTQWNIKEALSQVFWTTNRDGLGILQIDPVIDTEDSSDVLYITNEMEFMEHFPNPQDSGLSLQEFISLKQEAMQATEDDPLEIPIREEKVLYQGPRAEVVELVDFVVLPATAKSIKRADARGYGKRFYMRKGEVKRKSKEGFYYSEEVKKLFGNSTGSEPTSYQRSKDFAQGLSRSGKSEDCCLFELVYRFTLSPGGKEEKLLVVYSLEKDCILSARLYPYRVDNYSLFRIESKPNQLIGNSIPWGLSDLNDEVDAQHNQRINSRTISQVPSFKAGMDIKGEFDPQALENQWRPGVIFWLRDFDKFEQFKVQPTDLGSSIQEEQNTLKYCTLWAGLDPFAFSGLPQSDDPDAPGNKTIALIGQANLRMDDPLAELREGVEETGRICMSHEYQFGPPMLEYQAQDGVQKIKKSVSKRWLRGVWSVNMHGVTVAMNPEAEFAKWMAIYKLLVIEPVIANSAKRRIEILKQALRNGRISGREKILPSIEEIEQEEIEMMAAAQVKAQQMMAQQQEQQAAEVQGQAKKEKGQRIQQTLKEIKALEQLKEKVSAQNGGIPNAQ